VACGWMNVGVLWMMYVDVQDELIRRLNEATASMDWKEGAT